jgi:predicted enzyme related to lactoylglutathione lyase
MPRVQLALNVPDLQGAVAFYSTLFETEPAKVRPGYANFAIAQPPLKLVLIEDSTRRPGSLNHLGVELETTERVAAAGARLAAAGLATSVEGEVTCCYALQDKVWVDGPGGPWELYTVLADVDAPGGGGNGRDGASAPCCATWPDQPVSGTEPAPSCS